MSSDSPSSAGPVPSTSARVRRPYVWGATPAEIAATYPADELVPDGMPLTRVISVTAPAPTTFRWVCQLQRAPYSWDVIDNRGRRSPSTAVDLHLEPGQEFLSVLRLTEVGKLSLTARNTVSGERRFGPLAVTYSCEPVGTYTRLVQRVRLAPRRAGRGVEPLVWADLAMTTKQLRTLKHYAERDARADRAARPARATGVPLTLSARPDENPPSD